MTDMTERAQPILIERGPLLNFYSSPIVMEHPHTGELVSYRTVEHRFQAMKSTCLESYSKREAVHDQIRCAPGPREAKVLGRKIRIVTYEWDLRSYAEMVDTLYDEFTQNTNI